MSLCDRCDLRNNPCTLYKDIIVVTCGRFVQNSQDETISQPLQVNESIPKTIIQMPKIDEYELRKREKKRIIDDIEKGRGEPDIAGLKKMYGEEDSQLIKDAKKELMKGR